MNGFAVHEAAGLLARRRARHLCGRQPCAFCTFLMALDAGFAPPSLLLFESAGTRKRSSNRRSDLGGIVETHREVQEIPLGFGLSAFIVVGLIGASGGEDHIPKSTAPAVLAGKSPVGRPTHKWSILLHWFWDLDIQPRTPRSLGLETLGGDREGGNGRGFGPGV